MMMRVKSVINKNETKCFYINNPDSPASKALQSERTNSGHRIAAIVSAPSRNPVVDLPCLMTVDDG